MANANALPVLDPLGFTNDTAGGMPNGRNARDAADDGEDDEDDDGAPTRRRARRRVREDLDNIPRVKDATGEKVMERFADFLEKCVGWCVCLVLQKTKC